MTDAAPHVRRRPTTSSPSTIRRGSSKRRWLTVREAAAHLGYGVVSLRRLLDRHARRAPDGGVEAALDGLIGKKLGRSWRVTLGARWQPPSEGEG
jgi:hypothetical protein